MGTVERPGWLSFKYSPLSACRSRQPTYSAISYNLTRTEYYRQLDLSSKDPKGILSFLFYAVRGFVDSLREQLALIRGQQMDVTWRNYVHETLGHVKSAAETRQRHMVLDLSLEAEPVPLSRLTAISPRVAKDYAGISERTLARDLKELLSRGYLVRTKDGMAANRSVITAFLPASISQIPNRNDHRRHCGPYPASICDGEAAGVPIPFQPSAFHPALDPLPPSAI